MNNGYRIFLKSFVYLLLLATSFGRDILFRKVATSYGIEGSLGEIYEREFATRMFSYATWQERLYCSRSDPDVNETLEIYLKADGSHWLSYRRASPALSEIIEASARLPKKSELKKRLDRVHISGNEIPLPFELSNELQLLWRKMLPGVSKEPRSDVHTYYLNAPVFVGFVRDQRSVKVGRIATTAYDTDAYKEFTGIVDDLIKACDPSATDREAILSRLPANMRSLRSRL